MNARHNVSTIELAQFPFWLERQLQCQLELPRSVHRAGDRSCETGNKTCCGCCGRADLIHRVVGDAELRRVKQVESFQPELQFPILFKREVLKERSVNIVDCWATQRAAPRVTVIVRESLSGSQRWDHIGCGIVPALNRLLIERASHA